MNEFVGIVPFLRIAFAADTKTMCFHIAQSVFVFRTTCFRI